MAGNFTTAAATGGPLFAADSVDNIMFPRVKPVWGADGVCQDVDAAHPLPVADSAAASALAAILAKLPSTPATAAGQADQLAALAPLASILTAVQALASAQPLPTGAATSAAQTAGNASLTAIVNALAALVVAPKQGTLTDRSGTITAGGTAQQAIAANAARLGFSVQNLSTTADLWINSLGTAAAAQPSIKLTPGTYFETPAGYGSLGAVSVFSATTGVAYSAREW